MLVSSSVVSGTGRLRSSRSLTWNFHSRPHQLYLLTMVVLHVVLSQLALSQWHKWCMRSRLYHIKTAIITRRSVVATTDTLLTSQYLLLCLALHCFFIWRPSMSADLSVAATHAPSHRQCRPSKTATDIYGSCVAAFSSCSFSYLIIVIAIFIS